MFEHSVPVASESGMRVVVDEKRAFAPDYVPSLVHDLKGPLAAITMNVDFAVDQLPKGPEFDVVRAALADCHQATGRLFRMIANVLDVSKMEAGRLDLESAPVAVPLLVQEIADAGALEAEARGVKIHVQLELGMSPVAVDVEVLTRVVENLLENSLAHARSGGNILLSARHTEGGALELAVGNDGPAISAEQKDKVFDRHSPSTSSVTRRLALHFCRFAIEAMGGTITLTEFPGFPTCFAIRLPAPATL